MNVAKWLLLAILALPIAELAVFIAVAAAIGFGWALGLMLATSLTGGLILRHAGGNHIARVRTAMNQGLNQGSFTAVQADGDGVATLFAGILLLIPGFITDALGVLLLIAPLRRALAGAFGAAQPPRRSDGIVDLEPEQWQRVPDKELPDHRGNDGRL
ncbi:MAG TPA: FxsA family protein [Pseudolabrys sp.]